MASSNNEQGEVYGTVGPSLANRNQGVGVFTMTELLIHYDQGGSSGLFSPSFHVSLLSIDYVLLRGYCSFVFVPLPSELS